MRPAVIPLLLVMGSCAASPFNQTQLLEALDALSPEQNPRLFLAADQAPYWVIPIAYSDLPTIVSRTARAVQPGGELRFTGKVYGGPEDAYLIETVYAEIADDHLRRMIIASDGRVLLRSHSLPKSDLPEELAARIAAKGKLETLEFVAGDGPSYYRVTILDADGARRVRSYTLAGDPLWQARVLTIEASVSR